MYTEQGVAIVSAVLHIYLPDLLHTETTPMKTIPLILTLVFSTVFGQTDCEKCDMGEIKTVSENLDDLTLPMVEGFLCTFDRSCETNTEYLEWSNEMLYKVIYTNPGLVLKAAEQDRAGNTQILLKALENPIHPVEYQKIYNKLRGTKTTCDFKENALKSIELAAGKQGLRIEK